VKIQQNVSLKQYNTFGIDVKAKYFVEVTSLEELKAVLGSEEYPDKFILGGGSNMLLTKDVEALVILIGLKGIRITEKEPSFTHVEVMAGENWHHLVLWTLEQDLGGLENLSLIPGSVGSAPIQNIGAYGVELKDHFHHCEVMDLDTQETSTFSLAECQFGYRDSYFKKEGKGKYVITSVTFRLSSIDHVLHTGYGTIEAELAATGIAHPTIQDISRAVIRIRQSKLPDPKILGNSGSFFKNPVISLKHYQDLLQDHPQLPSYKVADNAVKIPAAWLIEACGFKGKRVGDAGVHKNQALVLVNYGNASGTELLALARKIQRSVSDAFGITIEPEVNVF
jgi:UDP-N-acetylmuramate dehydrogenase